MRLNIGAKLGLSAAIGLLLAIGTAAVQLNVDAEIGQAVDENAAQAEILEISMRAASNLQKLRADERDIRASFNAGEIDQLVAGMQASLKSTSADLARAGQMAQSPENRQRLKDLALQTTRYVGAATAIGDKQKGLVEATAKLEKFTKDWAAQYQFARSDFSAVGGNYANVLAGVNARIQETSIVLWTLVATGNATASSTLDAKLMATRDDFKSIHRNLADNPVLEQLKPLEDLFKQYTGIVNFVVARTVSKAEIANTDAASAAAAALALSDTLVADVRKRTAEAAQTTGVAISNGETLMLSMLGGLVLVLLGSAVYAAFGVARPIALVTKAMEKIAKGDLETPIPYEKRSDELGEQAHVLAIFRDDLAETERMREEQARLEAEMAEQRKRDMHELANRFEGAVGEIVEMVSSAAAELEAAAQTLTATAEETTAQAAAVAAAAEQAATNVQTVAAAVEELASSSAEIGNQVSYSTSVTAQAVSEADSTNSRMGGLKSAAEQVGAIVGMIGDIAAQTNLLALNATIESARAGEAGRGFAVVAQEVKSLAEQTSKATSQISGQISGIQGSTGDAVTAITSVGRTISEINQVAAAIGAAVEQQNATTAEIARNVQQAAQGTQEVTRNITGVTHAAQASSSASVQVLSSAGKLNRQASNLRLEVENFLTTVRAA
ncbi:Methyl-accepting chemotaxis protein [Pseudoxanthobacter soli DSM 19599]|uniref:Methyl-accepting chemotaxis protein n=1 Tax=Pseudoxanthobacter soli DSM 19599 TaxID=1123029 RepID=A0A1M7ZJ62_9HYPH|nr:HAMP domain-containing methyl-accepting chemotaxis protein [Pseudoxanthobacter soli]SHO64907.1 Methyl-accepting chemotaxis protein [Pseudoxanthobacter soli DSM 19599]